MRRIVIKDSDGYKYDITLNNFLRWNTCIVGKNNPYSLENISLWLTKNKKRFTLKSGNVYKRSNEKLIFSCFDCGEDFYMGWNAVISGAGCAVCCGMQVTEKTSLAYLRPDLVKEWSEKNSISPFSVRVYSAKQVFWRCQKCGYEWKSSISSHSYGGGCPACSGAVASDKNRLSVLYPEIAKEWDYEKNKTLKLADISFGSHKKVWWRCWFCGYGWVSTVKHRTIEKSGCPECNISRGEKQVLNFLIKNNIRHSFQHKFNDCINISPLTFDFYLFNLNACVEYNGQQHYEPVSIFGGEKAFIKNKQRDKIKREYCIENNIGFLEIPYWEFDNIEKILGEYLGV